MKLYNTLSRKIEDIQPLNAPTVTVYTCGPTVYDYPHIGNWFTFVRYDLLVRTLKQAGFEPHWVLNITDVGHLVSDADEGEDKLEKGARREGKTAWDVAKLYTDNFVAGLERLNFTMPTQLPKATEHIQEQIDLVKKLEAKGYTYIIDDGVYYDTAKFTHYKDFARLDLDEQQAGKRVGHNPQKRNPSDFALWKFSPKNQKRDMEWDSPWGKGFPGWHLECSAMSMKYLGETMDIHAGGIDHVPVHHTNEIAQSEAVTGKPLAKAWMHANHILINDEKISKSLGNGITLEAVEAKGYSPMVLRLHILESHYRSQSKFSWASLEAANNRLKSYYRMADLQFQLADTHVWLAERQTESIAAALQDDLNTPIALANLSALATLAEEKLIARAEAHTFGNLLLELDAALGLDLAKRSDITSQQKQLIAQRQQAREAKDWAKADELRDQLTKQSIGVRDTAHGPIWFRQ